MSQGWGGKEEVRRTEFGAWRADSSRDRSLKSSPGSLLQGLDLLTCVSEDERAIQKVGGSPLPRWSCSPCIASAIGDWRHCQISNLDSSQCPVHCMHSLAALLAAYQVLAKATTLRFEFFREESARTATAQQPEAGAAGKVCHMIVWLLPGCAVSPVLHAACCCLPCRVGQRMKARITHDRCPSRCRTWTRGRRGSRRSCSSWCSAMGCRRSTGGA